MDEILRKNLPYLFRKRSDVHMEEVSMIDQIMTDGHSVGASFKLIFYEYKKTPLITIFVFPERRWYSTTECPPDIAAAMDNWISTLWVSKL